MHKSRILSALLALLTLLIAACGTTATHPSLRPPAALSSSTPANTLVPVRQYVADWDGAGWYQLSPDGLQLMWIGRVGLGRGLFVKDLQTTQVQSLKTLGFPRWALDSRRIYLSMDKGGDENPHIYELDSRNLSVVGKDITPFAGAASFVQNDITGSANLLISSNKRDRKVFDLYVYTQATGELKLLAQNPGDVAQWLTNKKGQLLARVRKQDLEWVIEKPSPIQAQTQAGQWLPLLTTSYFDSMATLGMGPNDAFVWALSNRGRNTQALVKIDMSTGTEEVVFSDSRVDVRQAWINPESQQALVATIEPDYPELKIFDTQLQAAIQRIQGNSRSRFQLTSMSRDGQMLTGVLTREDGGQHVLYNLKTEQLTVLAQSSRSRIQAISPLPVQTPMTFNARDGLPLKAYLTLPQGVPAKNLPTVLYVHGGPWQRDSWEHGDTMPSFLANRGYAVLQVNYRGSSGYGRSFQEAARGEFAGKMHDDLIDGVDELVKQGISDRSKIAIMGASYGGYASLVGMTFTPDRFACGISFVGMSDLASLLENAPPYWEFGKPWWFSYVGDPSKPQERALMDTKSPLFKADKVKGPLLILHGVNDPRVKYDQSTRMVDALQKAGKSVDFVTFKGAGHGTQKWSDTLKYYRKTEDFLSQCLGGNSRGLDFYELGAWAF